MYKNGCIRTLFSPLYLLLYYVLVSLIIIPHKCKNDSFNLLPSQSILLTYEKESEELSNQKQYVVRLNAKVLAQREKLEKSIQQNMFKSPTVSKQYSLGQGSYFLNPGKSLGSFLRRISNEELCVTKMQAIYDTLTTTDLIQDLGQILDEISLKISSKVKDYLSVVDANAHYIEEVLSTVKFRFGRTDIACCDLDQDTLHYDEHFGVDVTLEKGCMTLPYSHSTSGYIAKNFSSTFKAQYHKVPSLLWQYFISLDGAHFEYPGYQLDFIHNCGQKTDRHRHIYFNTAQSKTKHIIIVMDQGNSLSMFQFGSAKVISRHILGQLSSHDKVTVFGLASDINLAQGSNCSHDGWLFANSETKLELIQFFDSLSRKPNATDHILGFHKIFEIIHELEHKANNSHHEILVAYISRGLFSSLMDAKQVLQIISDGVLISKSHIIINTYVLIDNERPLMYEMDFLQDIAHQNFKKYNIHHAMSQKYQKGVMVPVNDTEYISTTIGDIFKHFPLHPITKPVFSLPYFDSVSKGMVVSISQPVFHHGNVAGITAIDISLADIVDDVSYFKSAESVYIFLIDESGIALSHPTFSQPSYAHVHSYIWHLEDKPGFRSHYKAMLQEPSGELALPLESSKNESIKNEKIAIYSWRKVDETPYILCIVSIQPVKSKKILKEMLYAGHADFFYHRLDMLTSSNNCRHMKQLSSLEKPAIFFSSSCFISPYKYLSEEETPDQVLKYMTFLKDSRNTVTNPGFKPGIRNEVLALSQIATSWKEALEREEISSYIIRRFIATESGVFQVYPASLIDKTYDPRHRDWYTRALEHPGKIILTAPYLDVGGAGYIVTLSQTIFEGKPNAMHSTDDNVVAVMGLDFTFGFFYKFLLDQVPICQLDHIICFLLDDMGYLVSHPDLIDPTRNGPVEQQHITHKEPSVANDLLNYRTFVTKKICASYGDRTIQRYYQFNTSLGTILTNLVHGEHCSKYQVMHMFGSNVFLGIVNQTCDGVTAFCPCSMSDRLCLNCHRMEPTECECPCECSLKMDLCSGKLLNETIHYPTCPNFPELPGFATISYNLEDLESCYDYHCSFRKDISDCLGVLGCEWCQMESDGVTPLAVKFCTDQRRCFGGVFASRTPYGDEIIEELPEGEYLVTKNNGLGPGAGVFVTLCILFILVVYFFRSSRNNRHLEGQMAPHSNLRMSQLGHENEELDSFREPIEQIPPLCRQLIPNMENIASPYRVPTNYRRPTAGDSDHGYSTMTPHEDSELAPYFEPLLIGRAPSEAAPSSRTSSPLSCVPSSVSSYNHNTLLKADKDCFEAKRACVLAHVQIHSQNTD